MLKLRDLGEIYTQKKLSNLEPSSLTDEELLSVILCNGGKSRGNDETRIVGEAMASLTIDTNIETERLTKIKGVSVARARLLVAALEFARRRLKPEGAKIRRAADVLPLLSSLLYQPQEHVVSISLNGAHEVIRIRTVGVGLLTSCPIHPREIFAGPITDRALSVVIAHNHPSGDPTPSDEDKKATKSIAAAASIIGIKLLDHIVVARRGFFSFQESGLL